jgi:hypothetical protein
LLIGDELVIRQVWQLSGKTEAQPKADEFVWKANSVELNIQSHLCSMERI